MRLCLLAELAAAESPPGERGCRNPCGRGRHDMQRLLVIRGDSSLNMSSHKNVSSHVRDIALTAFTQAMHTRPVGECRPSLGMVPGDRT